MIDISISYVILFKIAGEIGGTITNNAHKLGLLCFLLKKNSICTENRGKIELKKVHYGLKIQKHLNLSEIGLQK